MREMGYGKGMKKGTKKGGKKGGYNLQSGKYCSK
jgi:hypothetical protein